MSQHRHTVTELASPPQRYVLLFFMDGVGLGAANGTNPFAKANMPHLVELLKNERWYVAGNGLVHGPRASLVPTDARLGMPGRPQSATGQAAILTGRNVPELVGEHYGPKPNAAVAALVAEGNLFAEVVQARGKAALLTPYPQGYFDAVASGKRLLSSVPLAATSAGLELMNAEDLRAGRAVSPGFTGQAWHDFLGYTDIPIFSLPEAGRQIARLARGYHFSFFEHWPSDRSGHRGSYEEAVAHLEMIDEALGGLLAEWDDEQGLLIITSDHGNIEDKEHGRHTLNPVPTILVGRDHRKLAAHVNDLTNIARIVRYHLGLAPLPTSTN